MPSQTEIQKVVKNVIDPLKRHWAIDFDTETINDFVDDLKGFSESDLQNSVKQLRRESKRKPTLAQIYGLCREYSPLAKKSFDSKRVFHCSGHAEIHHPAIAMQILSSSIGQKSLQAGVARELMVEYEISGRTEFDDRFIENSQRALRDSTLALSECLSAKNPEYPSFLAMFEESQAREKRLYAKYFRVAA